MRKLAVAAVLALVSVAGIASSVSADPDPEGALWSGFNTYCNGGEAVGVATFDHGAAAWLHAANSAYIADTFGDAELPNYGIGAVRLSPVPSWPNGPFCGTNTFGMWVTVLDVRSALAEFPEMVWYLDGHELSSARTPIKPVFDPDGFLQDILGERAFWFSDGVPVYGTLDPGEHTLTVEFEFPDGPPVVVSNTIYVEHC